MILSVEINDKHINILQAQKKGEVLSISNCLTIDILPNKNRGQIDFNYIYDVLNEAFTAYHLKAKKTVFLINSNKIIIRKIKLPLLKKQSEILSMLKNELTQVIPVDLNLYQLKYKIINNRNNDNVYYVVYCMPLELIDQYAKLADRLKLKNVIYDVSSNCLNKIAEHKLMINNEIIYDEAIAVAEIIDNKMIFSVLNKGVIDFSTTAMLGDECAEIAAEAEAAYITDDISCDDMFSSKCLDEISKYIRFYQSIDYESKINKLYVYGIIEHVDNLLYFVSKYLKLEVFIITDISNICFTSSEARNHFKIYKYFITLLAAFNDKDDIYFEQIKNDIITRLKKIDYKYTALLLIVIMISLCVFIFIKGNNYNKIKLFIEDEDNNRLNNEIEETKKEIIALENYINNIELLKNTCEKSDIVNIQLFHEIKKAMPYSTRVTSLSVEKDSTQLNCSSKTIKEITLFLNNLRGIEHIESIYVPSVEIKQNENKEYSYMVVCILKDVVVVD